MNDRDVMPRGHGEIPRLTVMQIIEAPRHGVARHDSPRDERISSAAGQEILEFVVMAQVGENIVAFGCKGFKSIRHLKQLEALLCGAPPRRIGSDQSVELASEFEEQQLFDNVNLGDLRAVAGENPDKVVYLQPLQGLAHRGSANAEL